MVGLAGGDARHDSTVCCAERWLLACPSSGAARVQGMSAQQAPDDQPELFAVPDAVVYHSDERCPKLEGAERSTLIRGPEVKVGRTPCPICSPRGKDGETFGSY